jgi:ABC-type phosphate transport system substrate-binding protein
MATAPRARILVHLGLAFALALGRAALAADAEPPPAPELAVIVHRGTAPDGLDRVQLAALFTAARQRWGDGSPVIAFNLGAGSPLRRAFDRAVLGMTPEQVGRFWVDQRVRGGPRPPRTLPDPATAIKLVARIKGAIAYVPAAAVDNTVAVAARVRDGAVVKTPSGRK